MNETRGDAPKSGPGVGCVVILVLALLAAFVPSGGLRSLFCVGLVVAAVIAVVQWSKRQEQEKLRAARLEPPPEDPHMAQAAAAHPPLGNGYILKVRLTSADGKHSEAPSVHRRLAVTENEIRLATIPAQPDPAGARAGVPAAIAIADIGSIRVEPNALVVRWLSAYGESILILQPRSYNDRERLTWELAVRAPDAMERGLDAAAQ